MTGHALVFNSGMGGLTIARALREAAPALAIDYAADTGFFPYGDKSDDELRARLPLVARALFERVRPDVFVIACNTASTLAIEDVRAALPCPVIGTVPAIKPAAAISKTGVIGLLATPGTIRRAYTDELIRTFASDIQVIKQGSTDLVRLAEASARGETPDPAAFRAVQAPIFEAEGGGKIDIIVLACTHFPLVRKELIESAPRQVTYIDSGEAIARQTLRKLEGASSNAKGGRAFITSAAAEQEGLRQVFSRFGFGTTEEIEVGKSPAP